jgi:hypothetical protein
MSCPKGALIGLASPLKSSLETVYEHIEHPVVYYVLMSEDMTMSLFRIWWTRIGEERREAYRKRIRSHRWQLAGFGASLTAFSAYAYESHVVVCPYTGRRKFVALTPEQMQKIGRAEFETGMKEYEEADALLPANHPIADRSSVVRCVEVF